MTSHASPQASRDTTSTKLRDLYVEELERIVKSGKHGSRGVRRIIDYTETHRVLRHQPSNRHGTWVWSDLHLRHANIIKYCARPFAGADEMDRALMAAWTSAVSDGDTVLNGGDIALAGSLRESDRAEIRRAPGRKLFTVGNHDFHRKTGFLEGSGHDAAAGVIVIESDPPMVLTHLPMGPLPPGWVNLYGHVHNNEPLRDTPHINVCVEHTDYRPLPLESILTLAKAVLTGRRPDGLTTADRIRSARRGTDGRRAAADA